MKNYVHKILLLFFRYDESSGVYLTSWRDDKVVHIASTAASSEPQSTARRFFRKERTLKTIYAVLKPSSCTTRRWPGRCWPKRPRCWILPHLNSREKMVLSNFFALDWRNHCKRLIVHRVLCGIPNDPCMDLLHFRIELSNSLLAIAISARSLSRVRRSVSDDLRYDGINHLIVPAKLNRCGMCSNNASFKCENVTAIFIKSASNCTTLDDWILLQF